MKRITVITYQYPNPSIPTRCPFIKGIVDEWTDLGIDVLVINPLKHREYLSYRLKSKVSDQYDGVIYPLYFTFPLLKFSPQLRKKLSDKSFEKAVERNLPDGEQIIYSHFLDAGYIAAKVGTRLGYKAYCAFGESGFWTLKLRNEKDLLKAFHNLDGFVSVSTENANRLVEKGYALENKILIAPNGVSLEKFARLDKLACRRELGLDKDAIIGIFVGHFSDRKGSHRVCEAVSGLNIKMIYIGSGAREPFGNEVVFKGLVDHKDVSKYLSSADFFVLPTRSEGCCNAIVEAMACGLPIISSNGGFNDDILDDSMSIRVDPDDINEIRSAVLQLMNDESLRNDMSKHAYEKAKQFDIRTRARKIAEYIGAFD